MPRKDTLRIHLLVQDPEGPMRSGGMELNTPHGKLQLSGPNNYRIACDPTLVMDELDRGTGEPWAVCCADCFNTEEFKRINRPKPGSLEATAGAGQVAAEDATPPRCPSC